MTEPAADAGTRSTTPFFWVMRKVFVAVVLTLLVLVVGLARAQDRPQTFDEVVANAAAARDQGDLPHAIGLYQQAVELNPKWPDGWWYLGSLQYGTNAYASAAEALTQYIALTPGAGPALALRGLCEFEEGKYPESLQDLQEGISHGAANQPRNAGIILYHEALLLTKTGRFEEALGPFTLMVKHGTINDDVISGIGLAGMRIPTFPKDLDPSQAEMVSMVGRAASDVMGGNLPQAHDAFQQIFQRFPTTPNLHYLYGYSRHARVGLWFAWRLRGLATECTKGRCRGSFPPNGTVGSGTGPGRNRRCGSRVATPSDGAGLGPTEPRGTLSAGQGLFQARQNRRCKAGTPSMPGNLGSRDGT
jgi:tetratricopeptide (TPR) repeat protein